MNAAGIFILSLGVCWVIQAVVLTRRYHRTIAAERSPAVE